MKKNVAILLGVISLVVIVLIGSWLILKPETSDNNTKKVYFGPGGEEEADKEIQEALDNEVKDTVEISFINLGTQDAEAILVKTKNHNILIDAGNNEGQDELAGFLDLKNVTKFDLFILTNAYVGHVGGADNLVADFEIDKIWQNGIPSVITSYKAYEFVVNDKDIDTEIVTIGYSKTFDGVKFNVVSPLDEPAQYSDSGDNSIVIELVHKDVSMLLMSNCKTECEEGLTSSQNIEADILKLGDYGSSKATTGALLEMVKPKVAIVFGNSINSQVENSLNEANIPLYRTVEGTITIVSDGTDYEITQ